MGPSPGKTIASLITEMRGSFRIHSGVAGEITVPPCGTHRTIERWEAAFSVGTLTSSFNDTFNFEIIPDEQISVDISVGVRGSQYGKNRAIFMKIEPVLLINPLGHVSSTLGPSPGDKVSSKTTDLLAS